MSNIDTTRVMGGATMGGDKTLVVPGGMGATMQMTAGLDPFRTQMGGTTTCPICKSTTPLLDSFCGECGFLLTSTPAEETAIPEEDAPIAELVDPQTGRRYRLHGGVNTVGRQDTDVLISDGTVSRHHANIVIEDGIISIIDLGSSNGTKVGDQRLGANQTANAMPGTPIRFGNWNVLVEMSEAKSTPPSSATLIFQSSDKTLVSDAFSNESTFTNIPIPANVAAMTPIVVSAPAGIQVAILRKTEGPAEDISVTEGTVSLGRKPGNTIVLMHDAYLSGRHCEIVTTAGETALIDLGSTNGTVVNGKKLSPNERLLLVEGDDVQIGQTKYRFEPVAPQIETEEEIELSNFEPGEFPKGDFPENAISDFRGQV